MDWILSHIPLVIALATFIGGWVSQQRKKSAEAKQQPEREIKRTTGTLPPPLKPADVADDPVRRIQEEIRRTIRERSRPAPREVNRPLAQSRPVSPAAKPRSAPLARRPAAPQINVPPKSLVSSPAPRDWEAENARLTDARRRESRKVDQAAVQTANAAQAAGTDGDNLWRNELRNPASVRKALILREVLGPPVSMRR